MTGAASPATIVLLPGFDGSGTLFAPLLAALRADTPRLVLSYPPDLALDYAQLIAYVRSHLDAVAANGERLVLVGESFSGPIAVELAAVLGERVAALVLVGSFADASLRWPWRRLVGPFARPWAMGVLVVRAAVRAMLLNGHRDRGAAERVIAATHRVDRVVCAVRAAEVARCDVRAVLARVTAPLVVVTARRDRLVGPRALHRIREARPDARVVVIDAPHMIAVAAPVPLAAVLDAAARGID